MDTVVVAAHRGTMMSGTTLWIVSVAITAAVAVVLFRHFRNRHQPGAETHS